MNRVLAFIKSEIAAGRPFPSRSAIAVAMGWRHDSSASDALMGLYRHGHLIVLKREKSGQGFRYHYALAEE